MLVQYTRFSSKILSKQSIFFYASVLSLKNKTLQYEMKCLSTRTANLNTKSLPKASITLNKSSKQLNQPTGSYLEEVLAKHDEKPKTTAQKVKKSVENTFFYSVCAVSAIAFAGLVYYIFDYFWAADSPQRIYSKAIKFICNDPRCLDLFGSQIAAHGETSGRGRRRRIANQRYEKDDVKRVRIVFYIQGNKKTGKVTAEVAKINGSWDFRFLLVETDGLVRDSIVVIDNR